MKVKDVLKQLDLGNSVAEEDRDLQKYFVETDTFRALVTDEADIIAGDKGTGKTALYKILTGRYGEIPELADVEVVTAFNPTGNSVFQQMAKGEVLTEGQYTTVWKSYALSLAGNWLLEIYEGNYTPSMEKLNIVLARAGLRTTDDPQTVFTKLIGIVNRIVKPKSAGVEVSFDDAGLPVLIPQIEFGNGEGEKHDDYILRHTETLRILNDALTEAGLSVWLVLDRLDEAFQGYPQTEIPALRALLRTYLDMKEFYHIKLKIFVRRDLFRKVTQGDQGFVNLTHINTRKIEVGWDDEDLLNLLVRRIRNNKEFSETIGLAGKTDEEVFNLLFPDQVELGKGRPKTWKWMLTRVRDGNGVKPPRNLIDLVKKAQREQHKREERELNDFQPGEPVISGEAIKSALTKLSEERVVDTLFAESGPYGAYIERFRNGKAEHNADSLMHVLDASPSEQRRITKVLQDMGFLEQTGETYKVPMLYRDGLNITQGKAFQAEDIRFDVVHVSDQNEGSTPNS
jgi:hypothetical protein